MRKNTVPPPGLCKETHPASAIADFFCHFSANAHKINKVAKNSVGKGKNIPYTAPHQLAECIIR
ncbi:hypothetical protein EPYR_02396 [Erwinia pyrifoliae DSM 12163]|nr:hypothetical protein EPYR_02396 [Erwinia pyrifoliae DSM 12163]